MKIYFRFSLRQSKKKGFTLIEVIIAVSIVVILASLSVPKVTGYIDKAKDAKALTCGKQLYTAAMWSYNEQGNKFDSTQVLNTITASTGINVTASSIAVTDTNNVTINFSSDNKSYSIAINASANSYIISNGARTVYSITQ